MPLDLKLMTQRLVFAMIVATVGCGGTVKQSPMDSLKKALTVQEAEFLEGEDPCALPAIQSLHAMQNRAIASSSIPTMRLAGAVFALQAPDHGEGVEWSPKAMDDFNLSPAVQSMLRRRALCVTRNIIVQGAHKAQLLTQLLAAYVLRLRLPLLRMNGIPSDLSDSVLRHKDPFMVGMAMVANAPMEQCDSFVITLARMSLDMANEQKLEAGLVARHLRRALTMSNRQHLAADFLEPPELTLSPGTDLSSFGQAHHNMMVRDEEKFISRELYISLFMPGHPVRVAFTARHRRLITYWTTIKHTFSREIAGFSAWQSQQLACHRQGGSK